MVRAKADSSGRERCSRNACRLRQGHVSHVGQWAERLGLSAPDGSCLIDVSKQSSSTVAQGTAFTLAGSDPKHVSHRNSTCGVHLGHLFCS
jgi:hypothetical protein